MTKDIDTPAFPMVVPQEWGMIQDGMSLRDWFAGQALAGMLADHTFDVDGPTIAETAYGIANAMLVARRKYTKG